MTRKDFQSIVDTLNEMNRNIEANEHEFNNSELLAQKNLMDMLAELFGANLNMFYENFDNTKFQRAYISNYQKEVNMVSLLEHFINVVNEVIEEIEEEEELLN